MPGSRLETHVSKEVKRHLEKLRKEASETTGRFVSMDALLAVIVEDALKRLPVEAFDEEKKELFLLISSS